ncbi:hypothetical protein ACFX1X_010894 [Malus domestica]
MSMTILGGGDSFCPPFLVRGWDELVCDLLIFEPHCRRKLIDESLVLGWLISLKDSVHAALIRVGKCDATFMHTSVPPTPTPTPTPTPVIVNHLYNKGGECVYTQHVK